MIRVFTSLWGSAGRAHARDLTTGHNRSSWAKSTGKSPLPDDMGGPRQSSGGPGSQTEGSTAAESLPCPIPPPSQEQAQGITGRGPALQPCAYAWQGWARKGRTNEIILHWALQVRKLTSYLHTLRAGVVRKPLHNHHHEDARTTKDLYRPFSCRLALFLI